MALKYQRILLKLSGEFFSSGHSSLSISKLNQLGATFSALLERGVEIGLVIGGGNLIRGMTLAEKGFDRITSDYMGMLATAINGLALTKALQESGVPTELMSLVSMPEIIANYSATTAIDHLSQGNVVVFAGGTGKPLCTTDSAASHRAVDIGADLLLKATKVNGVYSADPHKFPDAVYYPTLSYQEALDRGLEVMDFQSLEYCRDHRMPIRVFNMEQLDILQKIVEGETVGTLIS